MTDGKPDFSIMQRRSLMGDTMKIALAAQKTPVNFCAFDILYRDGELLTGRPLMERRALLEQTVTECERLSISRYIEANGVAFYNLVASQDLEGIVAKLKTSLYHPGKRTKEWIKVKNLKDDDFVVCGYIHKRKQYDKPGSGPVPRRTACLSGACDAWRLARGLAGYAARGMSVRRCAGRERRRRLACAGAGLYRAVYGTHRVRAYAAAGIPRLARRQSTAGMHPY